MAATVLNTANVSMGAPVMGDGVVGTPSCHDWRFPPLSVHAHRSARCPSQAGCLRVVSPGRQPLTGRGLSLHLGLRCSSASPAASSTARRNTSRTLA